MEGAARGAASGRRGQEDGGRSAAREIAWRRPPLSRRRTRLVLTEARPCRAAHIRVSLWLCVELVPGTMACLLMLLSVYSYLEANASEQVSAGKEITSMRLAAPLHSSPDRPNPASRKVQQLLERPLALLAENSADWACSVFVEPETWKPMLVTAHKRLGSDISVTSGVAGDCRTPRDTQRSLA